jgi:hypothetical protein
VTEWREVARYDSFGAASLACDELIARGIASRLRAETPAIDSVATTVEGFVWGGRPYHALDVSADAIDEANEALAEIRAQEVDDEIEPDAPPNAVAQRTASFLMQLIIFGFLAVIVVAIVGAVVSWADKEFFGG